MIDIHKLCPFDEKNLPDKVNIATITLHGYLKDVIINFENIMKNLEINEKICSMEYKGQIKCFNDIKISKTRKKKKSNFQNSMSLYILGNKLIHLNLFKNGTLHITGAKSIIDVDKAINNLFTSIKEDNDKYQYYTGELDLYKLKISMINVNIPLEYEINKDIFKKILLDKKYNCCFNKTQNISLKYTTSSNNSITTIIHKNSLIMSRCINENDIIETYYYIFDILQNLKGNIVYISNEDVLKENENLKKYICL